MIDVNILFPVLNEEKRLEKGIRETVNYMEKNIDNPYFLTIVDNGSTDKTEEISNQLSREFSQVNYIKTTQKGVGTAFREGVKNNQSDVVGYMDIDLSTDISHIKDMIQIFQGDKTVDMVNGSRHSKSSIVKGRKWYRSLTSKGLTIVMKLLLGMKASDSICGFKFYRKDFAKRMISISNTGENSWFFIIEMLVRAEKSNAKIIELPVKWEDDLNTTVNTKKLIKHYIKNILRLKKRVKES